MNIRHYVHTLSHVISYFGRLCRKAVVDVINLYRSERIESEDALAQLFKDNLGTRYKNLNLSSKAQSMPGMSSAYITVPKLVELLGKYVGIEDLV